MRSPGHVAVAFAAFVAILAAGACGDPEPEGGSDSGVTDSVGQADSVDGTGCQLDDDCPATGDPCRAARCTDSHQCVVSDRQGLPCDDGASCTVDTVCHKGTCGGGLDLCQCQQDADCVDVGLDPCAGAPICDKKKLPWRCASNPASAVLCDTSKDGPCSHNGCTPGTGTCAPVFRVDGSACEDGDPCTQAERCAAGTCVAKSNVCTCASDSDCVDLDDGDPCNGKWFCDGSTFPRVCKLNTASIVDCSDKDDTDCKKNTCQPADGACVMTAAPDAKACDDGDPCTNGDACKGGVCSAGSQDTCTCKSNADCLDKDDGDLCNGTLYCDLAMKKPACKLNPASLVNCVSVNNTACLVNVCYPKVGICQPTPIEATEPDCASGKDPDGICKRKLLPPGKTSGKVHKCTAGNPCTEDDVCKGGACVGGTDICACTSDAACESKFGDGDLCNGKLFCNQQTKLCALNPATVVSCPAATDTECSKNACDPKKGVCVATAVGKAKEVCAKPASGGAEVCKWHVKAAGQPIGKDLPCNDANKCTTGETCDGKGKCGGGTFTCDCKQDAECVAKDDGDLCNGTLFCNKAKNPSVCEHNPATVISCKSVDDDTCVKNACVTKTGTCQLSPVENVLQACAKGEDGKEVCTWKLQPAGTPPGVVFCDDGNKCTAKGLCKGGSCATGAMICECLKDADCEAKDDGNKCNGTLYCDKSGKLPKCTLNPASVVVCNKDPGSICLAAACNKATGGCGVVAHNEAKPCSDGSKCTSSDACQAGKCAGKLIDCDDGSKCTADSCSAKTGCVYEASNCSDGNACTVDQCDPKSGKCKFPTKPQDGTTCNADGSACTVNDACMGGTCKVGSPVKCEVALKECEQAACVSLDTSNFKCVKTLMADGAPCPDAAGCTIGATCKAGACEQGDKDKLYNKTWPVVGSIGQLAAVVAISDSTAVAVGGRWTGKVEAPTTSTWWVVQGLAAGGPGWSAKFSAVKGHVGHRATGIRRLADGGLLVAGGSSEPGFGLNARLVRLTGGGLIQWSKHYGKANVDEAALGLAARGNGSSILVGYRVAAGKRTPHVWRIAASGQFAAESSLDKWRGEARAVALDAAGLAAVYMTAKGFAGKQRGRLAVLDLKGAVVADVVVGDKAWHEARAVAMVPGGGWLLAGSFSDPSTGNEMRPWVVRTNANHLPRWQVHGKGQGSANAVAVDAGRRIRLAGTSNLSGSNANFWLQSMDELGNVHWDRHIDGSLKDAGHGLAATADGGLVMVGSRDVAGASQGAALRMDAWGHTSCDAAGVCMAKAATECDDGASCTFDNCLSVGGCSHTSGDGLACDPKDGCATEGTCAKGQCVPAGDGKLFGKTYVEGTLVAYKGLAALADGVIVAGNTVGEKRGSATLSRIDAAGKRLWHVKVFHHPDKYQYENRPIEGTSVLPAADGGYFLAGHFWRGQVLSNGQPNPALYKGTWINQLALTDKDGKKVWTKTIQDTFPFDSVARTLLSYPDGTLAVVGRHGDRAVVNRIKPTAVLVWGTELTLTGRRAEGHDAVVVAGGSTVVAGSVRRFTPFDDNKNFVGPPDGLVFEVDNAGKVTWQRRLFGAGDGQLDAVCGDDAGGSYAGGHRVLGGQTRSWLIRVAASGNVLWQKFGLGKDTHRIVSLARRGDGALLVGGQATVGIVDRAWLRAVNPAGSTIWDRTHLIGNVTRVSGNPVALLAKDEAVMVVTAVVAGKEGGALLRMDRWGKANCKELGKCHQGGALPCKDADPCTLDSCDAAKGCTFAPNKCDDGDACTVDSCAKNSGCKHAAVDCKDGDACSTDSCDPIAGCQHPPLVCPDSNQCTASKTTCKEAPACDGQLFDGRCLKAYDKDLTWFDAQHFCAAQGRHLAVVRSKADNVALRAIVENTCAVNTNLWLGVWQDKATGATWWLTTGEKATWFGWPKDKKPYVTKSKAAILQHANGLWATHATTSKALACFICEGFTGTCTVSPANEGKTCTGSGGSGWTCKEGKCCAKYYCL